VKIEFIIPGEPKGKGRPRFGGKTKGGRPIVRTPEDTAAYENLVVIEYRRQTGGAAFPAGVWLSLRADAYFAIPASAPKTRQKRMEDGEIRPVKRPDADNVLKIIADSLNGIAYYDDAQIADCRIRKFYARKPRVEVIILEGETANDEQA
jgi:Holliday junction resolvase RusA-like endonuclease